MDTSTKFEPGTLDTEAVMGLAPLIGRLLAVSIVETVPREGGAPGHSTVVGTLNGFKFVDPNPERPDRDVLFLYFQDGLFSSVSPTQGVILSTIRR